MPAVNLYLSEEEYMKLVLLAKRQEIKTTEMVRRIIRDFLEKQGKEG